MLMEALSVVGFLGLAVIAAIRICHGFRQQALSNTQAAEDRLPPRRRAGACPLT